MKKMMIMKVDEFSFFYLCKRQVINRILDRNEVAYGINTGFGNFANVVIGKDELKLLQENLIRSHAAG